MSYWSLFYHFVWSTKNRMPLLTTEIEPVIYEFLRHKAVSLGATVFALNGIEDHAHLVAAVPPKLSLAEFIGQVKGAASARFNHEAGNSDRVFAWQEEYGVFSFDGKRLPNYVAYVERQKEHHAQRTTIPILERTAAGKVKLVRERVPGYDFEEIEWRAELTALGNDD